MLEPRGKRVLVLGLGLSGRSAARFCATRGAEVVAAEERPADRVAGLEAIPPGVELRLGAPFPDPAPFDLVVPSPGVAAERWRGRARSAWGDVELAWAPPVAYGEAYCVRRSAARDGFHTGAYATLGCTLPGRPDLTTYVDAGAAQTAGEWYYQVVPVLNLPGGNGSAPSIMNGSTTYSIGIWTSAFAGSQAFGLPLRPETPRSVDWWASAIPGALGILWLSTGTWVPHFTEMPAGVYDAPLPQGGAVQVQVRTPARYAFVGT